MKSSKFHPSSTPVLCRARGAVPIEVQIDSRLREIFSDFGLESVQQSFQRILQEMGIPVSYHSTGDNSVPGSANNSTHGYNNTNNKSNNTTVLNHTTPGKPQQQQSISTPQQQAKARSMSGDSKDSGVGMPPTYTAPGHREAAAAAAALMASSRSTSTSATGDQSAAGAAAAPSPPPSSGPLHNNNSQSPPTPNHSVSNVTPSASGAPAAADYGYEYPEDAVVTSNTPTHYAPLNMSHHNNHNDGAHDTDGVTGVKKGFELVDEKKLKEYRLKTAMINSSFDPMICTDEDGIIVAYNKAAMSQFGFNHEQVKLVGQSIRILVEKDTLELMYDESLIGKRREISIKRRNGNEFPAIFGMEVIEIEGNYSDDDNGKRDDDGETTNELYFLSIRDITYEQRARQLLAEQYAVQEKTKTAIIEASYDCMFAVDTTGNISYVNKSAVRTFGYAHTAEMIGKNVKLIVSDTDNQRNDEFMRTFLETREKKTMSQPRKVMAKHHDGSDFPVMIFMEFAEPQNSPAMFVVHMRDITDDLDEKQKLEDEHKKIEEEYRTLQEELEEVKQQKGQDESKEEMIRTLQEELEETKTEKEQLRLQKKQLQQQTQETLDLLQHQLKESKNLKLQQQQQQKEQQEMLLKQQQQQATKTVVVSTSAKSTIPQSSMNDAPLRHAPISPAAHAVALEMMEQRAAKEIIVNMLPKEIVSRLDLEDLRGGCEEEENYATVLFADVLGYEELMEAPVEEREKMLYDLHARFDELVDKYGLVKMKTKGDSYVVSSIFGRRDINENTCVSVCHFAFDMLIAMVSHNCDFPEWPLNLKISVDTGPVIFPNELLNGSLSSPPRKRCLFYDLWGDADGLAARMENSGIPDHIQVTQTVTDMVPDGEFQLDRRAPVKVSTKGTLQTYYLKERLRSPDVRFVRSRAMFFV